ncbi:hypothetical protein MY1884_001958 [Beauveria asiatica]
MTTDEPGQACTHCSQVARAATKGHIARLYLNQSSSDPEWGKNYEGVY